MISRIHQDTFETKYLSYLPRDFQPHRMYFRGVTGDHNFRNYFQIQGFEMFDRWPLYVHVCSPVSVSKTEVWDFFNTQHNLFLLFFALFGAVLLAASKVWTASPEITKIHDFKYLDAKCRLNLNIWMVLKWPDS